MKGWAVERARPPGVTGLELWDHPLEGRPLFEHVGAERLAADRAAGIAEEAIARRMVAALARAVAALDAAGEVWIDGGLTRLDGFASACAAFDRPVRLGGGGRFAGEVGAARWLGDGVLVLDLGQTALKCSSPGGARASFERVPLDSRPAIVEWIAGSVARARRSAPGELLLALPAALDAAGVPGPSTYAGLEGYAELGRDLLRALGERLELPARGRLRLVNDAELAACAARPVAARCLALTLGFGPGAALVDPLDGPARSR